MRHAASFLLLSAVASLFAGCVRETIEEPTVFGHVDAPKKPGWSLWHRKTETRNELADPTNGVLPPVSPPPPAPAAN